MSLCLYYITARDKNEARAIGSTLVTERIVACANIFDNVESMYHWEGKLCNEAEAVLVVKTRKDLSETLIKRVTELHSYSCPCIVELPILAGNQAYLDWIRVETAPPESLPEC